MVDQYQSKEDGASKDDCCKRCLNRSGCVAVAFQNHKCKYVEGATPKHVHRPGSVLCILKGPSPPTPTPPMPPSPAPPSPPSPSGSDACLDHVNSIRKKYNLPPYYIPEPRQNYQDCTAEQAKRDSTITHKAHGSFAMCGEHAQGVAGGSCIQAIDAFMTEYPGGHSKGVVQGPGDPKYKAFSYGQYQNHVTINYYFAPAHRRLPCTNPKKPCSKQFCTECRCCGSANSNNVTSMLEDPASIEKFAGDRGVII